MEKNKRLELIDSAGTSLWSAINDYYKTLIPLARSYYMTDEEKAPLDGFIVTAKNLESRYKEIYDTLSPSEKEEVGYHRDIEEVIKEYIQDADNIGWLADSNIFRITPSSTEDEVREGIDRAYKIGKSYLEDRYEAESKNDEPTYNYANRVVTECYKILESVNERGKFFIDLLKMQEERLKGTRTPAMDVAAYRNIYNEVTGLGVKYAQLALSIVNKETLETLKMQYFPIIDKRIRELSYIFYEIPDNIIKQENLPSGNQLWHEITERPADFLRNQMEFPIKK